MPSLLMHLLRGSNSFRDLTITIMTGRQTVTSLTFISLVGSSRKDSDHPRSLLILALTYEWHHDNDNDDDGFKFAGCSFLRELDVWLKSQKYKALKTHPV